MGPSPLDSTLQLESNGIKICTMQLFCCFSTQQRNYRTANFVGMLLKKPANDSPQTHLSDDSITTSFHSHGQVCVEITNSITYRSISDQSMDNSGKTPSTYSLSASSKTPYANFRHNRTKNKIDNLSKNNYC